MADIEEDIRWDLEFDKVRDKDDLGLIMEDDWFLSDDILVSRVHELFDTRNPLCDELNELGGQFGFDLMELSEDIRLGEVKGLKRKVCDKDGKEEERGGECLRRKRVCRDGGDLNKSNDVSVLSYGEKLEKAKRKLREGYDSYSKNRKMSKVLSSKEVGLKGKLKNVVITKTTLKGNLNNKGQQCSNQNKVCKDGAKDVMVIDEKKKLNDVFKFSYAERVEMAKTKLQKGYDRCASERKKTCVISLKDIPKPACSKRVGRFKRQHCLPLLSNTISGY